MSDQYHWKKENEQSDLGYFLGAYAEATGETFGLVEQRETPDFVCERGNGDRVGIELTEIIAHPESRQWHHLFGDGPLSLTCDIVSGACDAVSNKASKLRKHGWPLSESMLVLHLFDNPLREIHRGLDAIDGDELAQSGFAEIWITDHSTIDAFGCVELIGLHPEGIAGYYALTDGCKPYG